MDVTRPTPHTTTPARTEPQITLLADGYSPAILDGQVLAVPLRPTTTDGEAYVPALIDGQVAAVPVYNPFAAAAATSPQPTPVAPVPVPVLDPGLPRAVQQSVLLGCAGALAAGALTWMVGAGVAEAAPYTDEIGKILMAAAATIATVFVGAAILLGKFKALIRGGTDGATATASGDNSHAAATVLAWNYRPEHHTTNIAKQTAGWKGTVNNNG
ncbi:hypothetical protein [Kitasatospora sp. NBC_00315]|uniref:hypothetical protein n=1 Tax=Kitasatospora sp. NBC_00315 TaxID=2975963 RepID=UPI00324B4AF9